VLLFQVNKHKSGAFTCHHAAAAARPAAARPAAAALLLVPMSTRTIAPAVVSSLRM